MSNVPYNNPNQFNAPPRKSKLPLILGIVFGLMLLCCGVGAVGFYMMYSYGMTEMGKMAVNSSPEAREALGEVKSANMDMKTMSENPGKLVLDVEGSKASGKLFMKQEPGQQPEALELRLSDGTVIPLDGSEPEEPKVELPKANAEETATP